ncbi:MAG: hypothetical protein HFG47_05000 [Lachnospiraceae bacterium]|nr:hypothetical protein [Lachnospiraceae bacterium]
MKEFLQNLNISKQTIIMIIIFVIAFTLSLTIRILIKRKKAKEEKQQAVRRMREEALDRVLANPLEEKKAVSFEKKRRPFQVEYSKDQNNLSNIPQMDKDMYQLTEITELSQRKYMFRRQEPVQIGNQFGNVVILPRDVDPGQVFCQIFYYKKENYLRSTGILEIALKRKGKVVIVNQSGLKLRSGDCFMVGKTAYHISFL